MGRGVNAHIAKCLNSVLNVKALLNQEKALVGAFSMIVKPMDRLRSTSEKHCATRHGSGDYLK